MMHPVMKSRLGVYLFCIALVAVSCARQGYPTGGPKDTTPPVAQTCSPTNESLHFNSPQFQIQFDEYVVLKNAEQNVLVSPPLKHKAEYSVKGKTVLVKLHDTLLANTTYLFQFKEAIADYTEGNLLPSFEYVFSTGDKMDTMMMAGNVLNALNRKPWRETLSVMAFRENDTTPAFITRTDKSGSFAFHYIPNGSYHLVAVEDKNRNLKVDADEPVAWLDEPVTTVDSIDSTRLSLMRISSPEHIRQRVLSSVMPAKGRIVIATAAPMQHPVVTGEQTVQRLNIKGDTLTLWCINPTCDSTVIVLTDEGLNDTIKIRYKRPRRRNATTPKEQPLMRALCSGQSVWYDDLRLAFINPMVSQNTELEADVIYLKDSFKLTYPVVLDSSGLQARIKARLKPDEDYLIRIPAGMFTDLYNTTTDTLSFKIKPKDYAILTMHIDNPDGGQLLVELLDSKDTVIQRRVLVGSGTLRFDHIAAGEYKIRAIDDRDANGRWSPGDYPTRRQPERFAVYGKPLQLRERWEVEERWTPIF